MARPKVRGIQPPPGQHPQPVAMPWRPGAFALLAVLFWLLAAWAAHDATDQLWQLAFGAGLMATVATGLLLRAWPLPRGHRTPPPRAGRP